MGIQYNCGTQFTGKRGWWLGKNYLEKAPPEGSANEKQLKNTALMLKKKKKYEIKGEYNKLWYSYLLGTLENL